MAGIIRVHAGGLAQLALVSSGVEPQGDLSLPSRGDGPVEMGHSTTSTGFNPLYLQNLITKILHLKGVFNLLSFVHLIEVVVLFLKDHPGAAQRLGEGKGVEKKGDRQAQERKQQNFLH
jgi:hypothetical protein